MKRIAVIVITLLLVHASANADFPKGMYDGAKLEQEQVRYKRIINKFYQVLSEHLDKRERHAQSGKIILDFPLKGKQLFHFYIDGSYDRATIFLPVSSLLFLEDLTTAFAWLHVNDYSAETVEEYVTMLKYKDASDFPGGRYPAPLKALSIPQDALSDKRVDALGLRLRNTAYAFIILHELAHFLYRHRPYNQISTEQARMNEAEADQFALKVLERAGTIPGGIIVYFMAQINAERNKGQFLVEGKSEAEWQRYVQTEQTHPLTAERLKGMARYLDAWASRASVDDEADTLAFIATRLLRMAEDYDDPDMQGCLTVVAERADPTTLAPRRHRSKLAEEILSEHCQKKR
jgi:hypothetical protein